VHVLLAPERVLDELLDGDVTLVEGDLRPELLFLFCVLHGRGLHGQSLGFQLAVQLVEDLLGAVVEVQVLHLGLVDGLKLEVVLDKVEVLDGLLLYVLRVLQRDDVRVREDLGRDQVLPVLRFAVQQLDGVALVDVARDAHGYDVRVVSERFVGDRVVELALLVLEVVQLDQLRELQLLASHRVLLELTKERHDVTVR